MSTAKLISNRRQIREAIELGRPIPHELRQALARAVELHLELAARFPDALVRLARRAEEQRR